jgi:hypothetical protein
MQTRRQFISASKKVVLAMAGVRILQPQAALASRPWVVRTVQDGDGSKLCALMQGCVSGAEAFFGACQPLEWTDAWVEHVLVERPDSVVVTYADEVVAYVDVPRAKVLGRDEPAPYRKAFWCGAAGVRTDLEADMAATVFRHAVWEALRSAGKNGYERVRCAAPWLRHPAFGRAFTEYMGLSIEPFNDERGRSRYLIEWEIEAALAALEQEGASADLNDITA